MSFKRTKMMWLGLLLISLSAMAQEWTAIGPLSSTFRSIEYDRDDANVMYASNKYTFYKSTDGGESWDIKYVVDSDNFEYLDISGIENDPVTESLVYFAANISFMSSAPENGLYRSNDNGESFTQVLSSPIEKFSIHPETGRIIMWESGWSGLIKYSDDQGDTWSDIPIPASENVFNVAADAVNDSVLFLTCYNGLFKSMDFGSNWSMIPADSIGAGVDRGSMIISHPVNSGEFYLGSYSSWNQWFYKTEDYGASWQAIELPRVDGVSDKPTFMKFGSNPDNIYLSETNEVFMSNDGGQTWRSNSWDINSEYFFAFDLAINPFSDDVAMAVSEIGTYETQDNGFSWTQYTMIAGSTLEMNVASEADGEYTVYAGNYNGLNVYSSTADEWTDYTDPSTFGGEIKALMTDPAMPGMVMIGKSNPLFNGFLEKSEDRGATSRTVWDNLDYGGGVITELVRSPLTPGTMYASTWYNNTPAEVLKSVDFGESWIVVDGNDNSHHAVTDVVVSYQNDNVIYTFGDGPLAKSLDGGATWFAPSNFNLPMQAGVYDGSISPFSDDILIVSSDDGTYKTIDGGENWYLVHEADCEVIEFNPVLPNLVFMITFDDELNISYDNGETWSSFQSTLNADLTDLVFSPNGATVYVSTTSQGIFTTELDLSFVSPLNVMTSVDAFNVTITWDAVEYATGYHVYRGDELVGVTQGGLSYMDYYVLPGTYEYRVVTLFNGIETGVSNAVLAIIDENALAIPSELTYAIQDFRDVALSWGEPSVPPSTQWLQWDDGTQAGTFESFSGGLYDLAVKYDSSDLVPYDGATLTSISFIPVNTLGTYSLKVWTGENAETLVANEPVSNLTYNEWNVIELTTPLVIDAAQPLYFGFTLDFFGGLAFTYDAGPAVADGKGGMVGIGGSWYTLMDAFGLDANLNLQGMVETVAQQTARLELDQYLMRELTGYNVYRDGELIGSTSLSENRTYLDADLEFDRYDYAVTAVSDEGESLPSNVVEVNLKDPFFPPSNISVTQTDIHDVSVSWNPPEFPTPNAELRYDSGNNFSYYESWMGGINSFVIVFTPEDLAEFDGLPLSSIGFIPSNSGATSYKLKIYTGANGENEVYSETLTDITYNEWNDFTPATEYIIDASVTHYFGYEIDAWGGIYCTYDQGPAAPNGQGGMVGMNGSWMTLMDAFWVDANINMSIKIEREVVNPVVTGYSLLREGTVIASFDTTDTRSYSDVGLDYGTHSYSMIALYDENDEVSQASDPVSIDLVSPYLAPDSLEAIQTDINEVSLSWVAPTFPTIMGQLGYDSGVYAGVYEAWGEGNYDVVIKYDAADLTPYVGTELLSIGFVPVNELATYTLKIWTGEGAENEVYAQSLSVLTYGDWNEVSLDSAFVVSDTSALYIGYNVQIFGGMAFTHDGASVVRPGYSDQVRMNGYWYDLMSGFGISGNVNLHASFDATPVPPAMEAYNVYRDGEVIHTTSDYLTLEYIDQGVSFGDHTYEISLVYELEESGPSNAAQVYLENPYYPPVNFLAEVDENSVVNLSWEMLSDQYNLSWDVGEFDDAVGASGGGDIIGAARFAPEHLAEAHGDTLTRLRFYLNDAAEVNLKLLSGELGDITLYEQSVVNPLSGSWNEVILTEPHIIDGDAWLWLAFEAVGTAADTYPIGLDEGPTEAWLADLVSTDDGASWISMSYYGVNKNVMIEGWVHDALGGESVLLLNSHLEGHELPQASGSIALAGPAANQRDMRETVLYGFNIYRDETLVAVIEDAGARSYVDEDVLVPEQAYVYHATALYTPDVESVASNADTLLVPVAISQGVLPESYALYGNYPNPFNPATTISFDLPESEHVKILIYDITGGHVQTLVNASMEAGAYQVVWNAQNQASGMYIYRMEAGAFSATRKLMLLK